MAPTATTRALSPARVLSVASAVSLALVLAGCGGSGTTPQFAARANAICGQADTEIEALPAAHSRSLHALATEARSEVPIVRSEVARLAALTAPSSEREEFTTALALERSEIGLIGKLIIAVDARDRARIARLAEQGDRIDARAKTATTELGLSECSIDAQPAA